MPIVSVNENKILGGNGKALLIQRAPIEFAIYSFDDESLTFYSVYNAEDVPSAGSTYGDKNVTEIYTNFEKKVYSGEEDIPWYAVRDSVMNVTFDSSFAGVRPKSLEMWFSDFENCTKIDLKYLNTSRATNMRHMFYNCGSLKTLDVSSFDTSRVTDMEEMFWNCVSISELDVSNWDVSNVTNLHDTFSGMENVEYLDVGKWDVRNVEIMYGTFYNCVKLETIPVDNWETDSVTSIHGTFDSCSGLVSENVSNWNTSKVTDMARVFYNDSSLKTIYSNDDNFVTTAVTDSGNMFSGCTNLVGGNGTVYSSRYVGASYAHVDVSGNPGYFTSLLPQAFAIYSADDNSLTFYYALKPLEGDSYNGKTVTNVYTGFETETWSSESSVSWYPIIDSITKVVIDASFKNVQPVSLALWFGGMTNCVTIEGLEFLDTRNVTTMYRLFRHCENITQLDVSTWDTSKVTTMEQTFSYCYKLKYLDLSNFDTSNVTAMNGMIRDASVLEELNLSGFDTNRVTMFNAFLRDSPNLKTIYADRDFAISANLTNDDNMFYNCTSLVGGNGTEYDSSKVTSDMAKIDRNGTQGYFTEK